MAKSGRSPPDPHVPPFAYYELGVLYAQDDKVSLDRTGFLLSLDWLATAKMSVLIGLEYVSHICCSYALVL